MHYADLTDPTNLVELVARVRPDEIYNLAAQSHVKVSFLVAEDTASADGVGVFMAGDFDDMPSLAEDNEKTEYKYKIKSGQPFKATLVWRARSHPTE